MLITASARRLTELGHYGEARDAYAQAVKLDPLNGIAAKNLQRLGKLAAEGSATPAPSPVDPRLFIEESGKTTVTVLTDVKRSEATAKLSAGDQMQIERRGNQMRRRRPAGQEIGRIEPKLEQDLIRLIDLGNQVLRLRHSRQRPAGARDHSRDAPLGADG